MARGSTQQQALVRAAKLDTVYGVAWPLAAKRLLMPTYQITIINEHFSQSGEQEASGPAEVWKKAIASAIAIAADQVSHGNPFFGAEITVEDGSERIGRYMVSVGATPLKD